MTLKVAELLPRKASALGATLGELHMGDVRLGMSCKSLQPGNLLLFDFDGVEAVNGSYIKATVYWAFICGQLSARSRPVEVFTTMAQTPALTMSTWQLQI